MELALIALVGVLTFIALVLAGCFYVLWRMCDAMRQWHDTLHATITRPVEVSSLHGPHGPIR